MADGEQTSFQGRAGAVYGLGKVSAGGTSTVKQFSRRPA
jgi:hypothetical protein